MRRTVVVVGLAAAVGLLALPAFAHVTVAADNTEPGGFAVYTVRVPNESETGTTTRIEIQIPEGLDASRYQPKPDWTMTIEGGVLTIEGGTIAPGEFEEFRFQARNPEEAGPLTFPAIQTYDDGEVVNWTGEPGTDTPAGVVEIGLVTDAAGTDPLAVTAIVVGALGLLVGGVALVRSR